jgi:hypothetical protein
MRGANSSQAIGCALEAIVVAYYKYPTHLHQQSGPEFDAIHHPGQATRYSGVYRCEGCGQSITSVGGHPMPPQDHHQHTSVQGTVRWRLVVKSHSR